MKLLTVLTAKKYRKLEQVLPLRFRIEKQLREASLHLSQLCEKLLKGEISLPKQKLANFRFNLELWNLVILEHNHKIESKAFLKALNSILKSCKASELKIELIKTKGLEILVGKEQQADLRVCAESFKKLIKQENKSESLQFKTSIGKQDLLRELISFPHLKRLSFSAKKTKLSLLSLRILPRLTELRFLQLSIAKQEDDLPLVHLEHVKRIHRKFPKLEELDIKGVRITKKAEDYLRKKGFKVLKGRKEVYAFRYDLS